MNAATTDSERLANPALARGAVIRTRLVAGPAVSRATATRKPPAAESGVSRKTVRNRLVADLRALGVREARPLLVHASLSHIGHVRGGAETVIDALLEVLGPDGTLVTGAGTPENSTTSRAFQQRTAGFDSGCARAVLRRDARVRPREHANLGRGHRRGAAEHARRAPQRPPAVIVRRRRPRGKRADGRPPGQVSPGRGLAAGEVV